ESASARARCGVGWRRRGRRSPAPSAWGSRRWRPARPPGAAHAAGARRGRIRAGRAAGAGRARSADRAMLEAVALNLVKYALSEDVGTGDITTLNAIGPAVKARGAIVANAHGAISGLDVARLTFREADPGLTSRELAEDGEIVEPGAAVAQVMGEVGGILKAERTALNFLQHLSGVASLTRRFVDEIRGTGATILDTRKTTPGLR